LGSLKRAALPAGSSFFTNTLQRFQPLEKPTRQGLSNVKIGQPIEVVAFSPQGRPTWVKGSLAINTRGIDAEDQAFLYLDELKNKMGIEHPMEEFQISKQQQDEYGQTHIRMEQYYHGLPVYAGEVILHEKEGKIIGFNGNYQPTPKVDIIPDLAQANAIDLVKTDLATKAKFMDFPKGGLNAQINPSHQVESQLVIYYDEGEVAHLAWQVKIHPNITEQWLYFVDAHSGAILTSRINSCHFAHDEYVQAAVAQAKSKKNVEDLPVSGDMDPLDGSLDASGFDLNNILRSFKTYTVTSQNTNFLIDVTRSMFNAGASNMPDEPVGAIFTIDGNNGSPQSNSFQVTHLVNSSNNWNDKTAVSAHYNAGLAYDYYRTTFGRNSINGEGGTIISIINVADENGQGMDNAFWNGQAMFYGNGKDAFKPLAGALDVAGHELSHGVIQNTANLVYQGESGALNESYADIFGAMIDRDDWKMGEDVVFTNVFTSGALRDLSDPHNGATQLGQPGYQPAHVSEQYTGSQDNGGVHINSGITNKAYYLIATAITKDKAEKIYYKALTDYLTKHSQFKDLRIAILKSAEDIYGVGSAEANAVGPAFDQVGIDGPNSGGGSTSPNNNYQNELEPNPGQDFIVYRDAANGNKLSMADASGSVVSGFTSAMASLSKPTVTDNGSNILYVADDHTIRNISFDWGGGSFTEVIFDSATDNRNVAVSPDGSRVAVLTTAYDDLVWVYDFTLNGWKSFELYNPTIDSSATYNVDAADVLHFDYSGEYVMYDAQSTIQNGQGADISYWDIGFLHVWDNGANTWADGNIDKLFSGLPENTSVGNPAFAKNSPYIIAFDFFDDSSLALWGANIETGDAEEIATNNVYSVPSFAPSDQYLLADSGINGGTGTEIYTVKL
ncbi:MAG TPA: neutral protease, partial [Saprospiraceae bacterium]|nr:neutral protease [Saprospiraceae bacterium]